MSSEISLEEAARLSGTSLATPEVAPTSENNDDSQWVYANMAYKIPKKLQSKQCRMHLSPIIIAQRIYDQASLYKKYSKIFRKKSEDMLGITTDRQISKKELMVLSFMYWDGYIALKTVAESFQKLLGTQLVQTRPICDGYKPIYDKSGQKIDAAASQKPSVSTTTPDTNEVPARTFRGYQSLLTNPRGFDRSRGKL